MPGAALARPFAGCVIDWQRRHGRHGLPWQGTRDPYRVWLSEIMLQQTQVSTALPYYQRFVARFPDVAALAAAHEDEVLALWSGLGYYTRARNLHRAARAVVERFDGRFPRSAAELATLPGIGRSTAAAIAGFCFGERAAILDGNVKRVITRAFGFDGDLSTAANERALWQLAESLLPEHDLAASMPSYTQGLMDLGATVCTRRRPDCARCPLRAICVAAAAGDAERYPVKTRRIARQNLTLWLLHARDAQGRTWLEQRPERGIWARLHSLPVFDSRQALLAALPPLTAGALQAHPPFRHALTHRELELHVLTATLANGVAPVGAGRWCAAREWPALALPAPVRNFLQSRQESLFNE